MLSLEANRSTQLDLAPRSTGVSDQARWLALLEQLCLSCRVAKLLYSELFLEFSDRGALWKRLKNHLYSLL